MPTQNFKVGEMLNKRTPNSKTWINFDGSYTTEIHMGLVHYQDESGNYHNINTDLVDEADMNSYDLPVSKEVKERFLQAKQRAKSDKQLNKLNRGLYDYQGLQVPFDCHIPRNFKRGYTIGKGEDKLTFKPVKSSPSKGYVEGNKITYPDVWSDTDVVLEVTPSGIKETIVLKTEKAPILFGFEVGGELNDKLKIQSAWLKDAEGSERDVVQGVRDDGNKTYVDLVADVTDLVYPIEIDPTVTIQPDGTTGKDTNVDSGNSNANEGNDIAIRIGGSYNSATRYISLVQFDLSTINSSSYIESSILTLTQSTRSGSLYITPYPILTTWEEGSVTHNTLPDYDENSPEVEVFVSSGTVFDFNIASMTQKWVDGELTNNGLILKADHSPEYVYFSSSEATTSSSYHPKLTVTYNQPPTAPTVITPNGGETWNSLHTVEWTGATDPSVDYIDCGINSSTGSNQDASSQQLMQTFKTAETTKYLESVKAVYNVISANVGVYVRIYEVSADLTTMTYIGGKYQTFPSTGMKTVETIFDSPLTLNPNTLYGIVWNNGDSGLGIYLTGYDYYSNGGAYRKTSTTWDTFGAYDFSSQLKFTTPSTTLQHQIQLTVDDGVNWYDIIALTNPGITSVPYDFINEPETSLARVRARGYDGSSYGPWDESDGVFTIVHNQAPTAPTNLSPSGGQPLDRAQSQRFTWQHNDPNSGDPQSKFDLQWRSQGNTTWNTISQVTINQFWDAVSNTLPRGTIEWRVRTYDQAGLSSPYSAIAVFFAGDKPAMPTITAPADGAIVSVANPTIQWSSVGQTGFNLKVKDETGANTLYEANQTSTNKAHTVQYDLSNQENYQIELTIDNADQLTSDPDQVDVEVSYTPPAVPILATSTNIDRGSITILIDNPTPSGTEPSVSYNVLFRRKQGGSEFIRIATDLPNDGEYTDYTVASEQVYEYMVRVWGDNGTYINSSVITESVAVNNAQLSSTVDSSAWVELVYNPQTDVTQGVERTTLQFAGRKDPVGYYSELDIWNAGLSFRVRKPSLETLRSLVNRRETLLFRDSEGRREFISIDTIDESDIMPGLYDVSFSPVRVSYKEEV